MNWVDLVMLGIVGLSAMAGFLRGFARELLGLVAWVAAVLLASHFYVAGLPLAHAWIEDGLIADVVCFMVVFVIILIGLSLAASLLSRLVRLSLGGVDRLLGFGFGAIRGGALLILAYVALAFFVPTRDWPAPLRQARALPYLHRGAAYALAQAPRRWRYLLPTIGPDAALASGQGSS